MKLDIEIARSVKMKEIADIASGTGILRDRIEQYGKYMAKVPMDLIDEEKVRRSKLILVTAITATKAGIGKTTASIGLALGMNKIGKKAVLALREPSLSPCFGMKGGAAGGGYAQVVPMEKIKEPSLEGVRKGFANLDRHIENLKGFGQSVMVCFNRYASDTPEEIDLVRRHCEEAGVAFAVNDGYAHGGDGAVDLARKVVETIEGHPSGPLEFTYSDGDSLKEKIEKVARGIYRAGNVIFSKTALRKLESAAQMGMSGFPVCIAKTQYSFSQDPKAYGAPSGFDFEINDIVVNAGAEMVVAIAGDIIRMPGLPKHPQALDINVENGFINGLS